jgi:hypothetical protein
MERALDEYAGTLFGRHPISQAWDGVGSGWMEEVLNVECE